MLTKKKLKMMKYIAKHDEVILIVLKPEDKYFGFCMEGENPFTQKLYKHLVNVVPDYGKPKTK